MKSFKIGDIVETIDDVITGRVVAVDGEQITVETNQGFPMKFAADELLIQVKGIQMDVTEEDLASAQIQEGAAAKRVQPNRISKQRSLPTMEVDLHIEKIINRPKLLESHEILDIQLNTARRQLNFAIRKGIPKVVFIHGVGDGVLKTELHFLLKRYPNVEFYDASFRKYGLGATEVSFSKKK